MPKQTFFNLPEAKRKAILDAAIEEFAGNDYQSASISRVVARVDIAKGSFYQYFEDKRDLYFYLLDLAFQERIAFVQNVQPIEPGLSIFAYAQSLLELGVRFSFVHPQLNQIIYRAMFTEGPLRSETLQRINERSLGYTRQILQQGIAAGEIRPDIDLDMVVYMVNLIMNDFSNFMVTRLGIDPQQLMAGNYSHLDMTALRDVFAKAMEFLQYGLATRRPE